MFLIEYDKGLFINATEIQRVNVNAGASRFTIKGDPKNSIAVSADYCKTFFNHLQVLNDNPISIESCWHKLNT